MSDRINDMANKNWKIIRIFNEPAPLVIDHCTRQSCDAVNKNKQSTLCLVYFLQGLYLVSLWSFLLVCYLKSTHFSCTYSSNWTCMFLEELVKIMIYVNNWCVVIERSSFRAVSVLFSVLFVIQLIWYEDPSGGRGGGANLESFIWGGSAPRFNPLPFCIPFWQKLPFLYALLLKRYLFLTYLLMNTASLF